MISLFEGAAVFPLQSRREMLSSGDQRDVSVIAREAGIVLPVFFTKAVWDFAVAVPPKVDGQDEDGRLWDVVWMLSRAINAMKAGGNSPSNRLEFVVYVRNTNRQPRPYKFVSTCEAKDYDDRAPVITISLPGED